MSKKIIDITSLERFSNNIKNYIDNSVIENVSTKQDKLVSGINIKTINGESILGEGDLTVEGGAKVYTWNWDSEGEEYILSQEEYDNIVDANIVVFNIPGIISGPIAKLSEELIEFTGECVLQGRIGTFDIHIRIVVSTKLATLTIKEQEIPTKTSQLENDSDFISSDSIKTINGESIIGEGDIVISVGSESTNVDWENIQNKPRVVTVDSGGATKDIYIIQRTNEQNFMFTPDKLLFNDYLDPENSFSIKGSGDLEFNCNGDGTKFLADDGTYKEISGGSSDANVQAVDTAETLDDVSGVTYVKYVAQTLTDEQKAQARANIGAENALKLHINERYINPENGIVDLNVVETSKISVDGDEFYTAIIPGIILNEYDGVRYALPNTLGDIFPESAADDELVAKSYVDGLVGDINSVLESIIND